MDPRLVKALLVVALLAAVFACTREPQQVEPGLLKYVPAQAPYAFVTSQHLPEGLRDRLAEYYAAQLAAQAKAFKRVRRQLEGSSETSKLAQQAVGFLDVVDALLVEFDGRETAAQIRELGIEPVTRSALYGIGLLPAMRVEIADAGKLNAMFDRVEKRAGLQATRGELNGQSYRRIDLGPVDVVLSVTDEHAIGGVLADALFDRDLPLLLGQRLPEPSLAEDGAIADLIKRHGFTGYGEGFIKLDALIATLLGKGDGRSADTLNALDARALPVSAGCMSLIDQMVSGMPRVVLGVSAADEHHLAVRSIWESTPAVASRLQKLAAPVAGVGAATDGLLAFGMGLDLPALRNGIEALLREVTTAGAACEWVDPDLLTKVMPQLNLALGPMTAGIKGFNLQLDELDIDPTSQRPVVVRAGLLAAVDDPRGIFALGAMFNPALAALDIPDDGSLVDLPVPAEIGADAPPMKVAIRDKALLLLAGTYPAGFVHPMLSAPTISPSPLLAVDYGIAQLVERFDDLIKKTSEELEQQGQLDVAQDLLDQLEGFRLQARIFERMRFSVAASDKGLVMDQMMTFR